MEAKLGSLFFLVLLLVAYEEGVNVAGRLQLDAPRVCQIQSGRFSGPCVGTNNCAQICVGEGYDGGSCDIIRRCMCQKKCNT